MTRICSYLSIVIQEVNDLNSLIKRHRVAGWIIKQKNKTELYAVTKGFT